MSELAVCRPLVWLNNTGRPNDQSVLKHCGLSCPSWRKHSSRKLPQRICFTHIKSGWGWILHRYEILRSKAGTNTSKDYLGFVFNVFGEGHIILRTSGLAWSEYMTNEAQVFCCYCTFISPYFCSLQRIQFYTFTKRGPPISWYPYMGISSVGALGVSRRSWIVWRDLWRPERY